MFIKSSLIYLNELIEYTTIQIRKLYLSSSFYNKKISKTDEKTLNYIPSLVLLSAIIKIPEKKNKLENLYLEKIWTNKNLKNKDFKKIHNFFWLFSLDLKSPKKEIQKIISLWIEKNYNYNYKIWENDILAKRLLSWISNSPLTYEEATEKYKDQFNFIIKKQVNHLINEIDRSDLVDDKLISCAAIILCGLSFNEKKYLDFGFILLNKIINSSLDNLGFPKSRNFRQLIFYLKYFILIREFLKESQTEIPDNLNEVIYHLGGGYNLIWQSKNINFLFNGNHDSNHSDLDLYLKLNDYKFKNASREIGGYNFFNNKNYSIVVDTGNAPEKKFSESYQAGPLSFEITFSGQKLITNSGYFQKNNHQLHKISKSTANHSTLSVNNTSAVRFIKNKDNKYLIEKNFKINNKKIISEENYWCVSAAHDGYLKQYGVIHERKIEFFPDKNNLIGTDILSRKKTNKYLPFEIRFHLFPSTKVTKTQDGNSILIEIGNSGWKFTSKNHLIGIETGLYFGDKNNYTENQNIFISEELKDKSHKVVWMIEKIQ